LGVLGVSVWLWLEFRLPSCAAAMLMTCWSDGALLTCRISEYCESESEKAEEATNERRARTEASKREFSEYVFLWNFCTFTIPYLSIHPSKGLHICTSHHVWGGM
jgi:hypothetical protein